ncbi:flagellar hook-basal body complex protein FliE [Ruminococcaceae bacterium OttesenSCG-928-D13]|nr:flagellar hook-basal body complex protein FliE [Ruminococcaceae bacterium OttesenSCG-928-D13]
MSEFIVPIQGLPSIASITEQSGQKNQKLSGGNLPFADMLQQAVNNLAQTADNNQANTHQLAVGGSDDLHTGAIDAVKYNSAVTYTSGMVNSVIRAYNQLIQMSI